MLIFFWIESSELAIQRVKTRVEQGGHNIPVETIIRRYKSGIVNLFSLYHDICDMVFIYDNSRSQPELIYEKQPNKSIIIYNPDKFNKIKLFTS